MFFYGAECDAQACSGTLGECASASEAGLGFIHNVIGLLWREDLGYFRSGGLNASNNAQKPQALLCKLITQYTISGGNCISWKLKAPVRGIRSTAVVRSQ